MITQHRDKALWHKDNKYFGRNKILECRNRDKGGTRFQNQSASNMSLHVTIAVYCGTAETNIETK